VIKYLTAGDNFLRQGPSGFEQAAQCYFKVLAVYPDKMNLLMNLEQNLPPPVMEIIVKLMAAEASKVDIE
jgi:import receptor subunit TOM20